jgi:O-antigen/teichoic acid export membrane protein
VATNVSWVIVTLAGSLNVLVLPIAARRGAAGSRTVIGSLHTTLGLALALAVPLAILAGPCVRLVYGAGFAGSVAALRILLPGCVLWAGTFVLMSGLYAVGRPLTATLGQASGLAITVVGLLLFLRSGGIEAAALVSTTAYTVAFVLLLYLYRRAAGIAWRELVPGLAPAPAASR